MPKAIDWTAWMDNLLGTISDRRIANKLGIDAHVVGKRRKYLGIPAYKKPQKIICKNCAGLKPHKAHGLCNTCYKRLHPGREITCVACNEFRPHYAHGLCKRCYGRQRIPREIICNDCGKPGPHGGRGLCRTCYMLVYNFGISRADYDAMLEVQNGSCWICKRPDKRGRGGLVIDHKHKTGEIRGILCTPCNQALGLFQDDNSILARAIEYLSDRIR